MEAARFHFLYHLSTRSSLLAPESSLSCRKRYYNLTVEMHLLLEATGSLGVRLRAPPKITNIVTLRYIFMIIKQNVPYAVSTLES